MENENQRPRDGKKDEEQQWQSKQKYAQTDAMNTQEG